MPTEKMHEEVCLRSGFSLSSMLNVQAGRGINNVIARTMTTKEISYKSGNKTCSRSKKQLERGEKEGIKQIWSVCVNKYGLATFTWNFDWRNLKTQGFDRLVGHLIVNSINDSWQPYKVDIDWTDTEQSISATPGRFHESFHGSYSVTFDYYLTAYSVGLPPPKKISYDEMFAASDKTDVVLIVQGKKLHVNKSFLSFHSDYFSTLFPPNFKEGQMEEIEIREVSYKDFGLLLSTIYPMLVFPSDETVEKLLELADRFLMPSVKHLVEHHLLDHSKFENQKLMMLGDQYGIKSVLDKSIWQTNTVEEMKKLKDSPEYVKLSPETVARLFERFVEIV
ncbi:unnamed protein product [Caenorhabditis nigoni]